MWDVSLTAQGLGVILRRRGCRYNVPQKNIANASGPEALRLARLKFAARVLDLLRRGTVIVWMDEMSVSFNLQDPFNPPVFF